MKTRLLVTIFSLLILISVSNGIHRASFGESCDSKIRCSSQSWLICKNGTCDCVQDTMKYREDVKKCVAKSGERCKFEIEGTNFVESTDCVKYAECSTDGICVCLSGFYEDLDQNCQQEKSYHESCNEIAKCESDSGLTCTHGKCMCNSNATEYSRNQQQCVGLIGEQCIQQKCTDIGHCDPTNNICVCPKNMFAQNKDSGMICLPKQTQGTACSSDDECIYSDASPLKCMQGKCDCDAQKGLIYDRSRNQCVGKVNERCHNELCTENANCEYYYKDTYDTYDYICICPSSYYQSDPDGTCKKPHNSDCTRTDQCAHGLECIKSTCQCKYHPLQVYKDGECYSKVEAPCYHSSLCDYHAYCQKFENSLIMGSCKCEEGFLEGKNRKCKAAYGTACNGEDNCDDFAGLQCINEKCACPGGFTQKYNETLRICVGLVGATCGRDKTQYACTENAECVLPRNSVLKESNISLGVDKFTPDRRCQCKEGYIPDENYECVMQIKGENLMDKLVSLLATKSLNSTEKPQADALTW